LARLDLGSNDSLPWQVGPSFSATEFYYSTHQSRDGSELVNPIPKNLFPGFFVSSRAVVVPHWFFVVAVATVAAVPWFRWRFSICTLLIAMTLVAVVLGVVVWAAKR
jgi:hypothetical protein